MGLLPAGLVVLSFHPSFWLWMCQLLITVSQVTADANLGAWLNKQYGDHDKFEKVLSRVVMQRPHDGYPSPVSLEPLSTTNDFVVDLTQLDYSQNAKHGCPFLKLVASVFFILMKCNLHFNKVSLSIICFLRLSTYGDPGGSLQEHSLQELWPVPWTIESSICQPGKPEHP